MTNEIIDLQKQWKELMEKVNQYKERLVSNVFFFLLNKTINVI